MATNNLSYMWRHFCQNLHVLNLGGSNPTRHLLAATVMDQRFWMRMVKFSTVPIFLFCFRILCHRERLATRVTSARKGEAGLLRLSNDDGSLVAKNEERKLAEQETKFGSKSRARTPRICVEEHAYACYNKPNPRLSNSITLRRGTFTSSFPRICVEVHAYAWKAPWQQATTLNPRQSHSSVTPNHAEPTPESFKRDSKLRKTHALLVTKHNTQEGG
ncbi:hypothetical protein PIB30_046726 [Stylosanthes scabra]|uniref:Uncharacterized protein n=1 Tax=Stylosanthes scabra TaxID=79078 RepID=A0ABU6ZFB4_9FABA|nr:hypothetical protein [Stylosanthes scabra]